MRRRLIVPQIVLFYTRFSFSNHKFKSLSNPAIFVCHIRLIVYETQIGAKSFEHTSDCFIILSDHKSKFFSNPSIFFYRTSNICLGAPNRRRPYVCAPWPEYSDTGAVFIQNEVQVPTIYLRQLKTGILISVIVVCYPSPSCNVALVLIPCIGVLVNKIMGLPSKRPSIYDVHTEGAEGVMLIWTNVDGGGGQAPCRRQHRKLKLESTDVILSSSSYAMKLASFLPEFRLWME